MKEPIHLLVPMSGQGTRYHKAGYKEPKPLIPVNGVPMIERLLSSFPAAWPATFVLAENHRSTALPKVLKRLRPKGKILYVPVHAKGPAVAIQAGVKAIPSGAPVFVSYCDYGMSWDAHAFETFVRDTNCDACLVSYRGFHAHYLSPVTYAYSRLEGETVVEVKEKGSFTDDRETEFASNGGYYFRTAAVLKKAVADQIRLGLQINGEFYTSLTVQALISSRRGANVRVFEIPSFHQWGTPEDLERFEYWERTARALNAETPATRGAVAQVLMPMAGKGSRFESLTRVPKPFLNVGGRPMFRKALDTLPAARKTVIVALEEARAFLPAAHPGLELVKLPQTPPGQALSTEAGLSRLDLDDEVIVSACDHGIATGAAWTKFRANPRCDAAIFTITGFPGARRSPNAFAYVQTETGRDAFPRVRGVSVKKPISDRPDRDPLLVGTFWFKTGRLLKDGIADLVKADVRVNGELYLDSVFNRFIEKGLTVRIVPLKGYVNWGDPDSLAEALYWQEAWGGHRLDRRPRFPGVAF